MTEWCYNSRMSNQLDFLAIGDITTDAFIKLSDAWVETDNPERAQELCMKFGEKIPYESVTVVRAVGNAPNAAVSAARLGLASGLLTNLGDDENGRECVEVLKKEAVDITYATVHKGAQTNYHYVLSFGAERTILVRHEAYRYTLPAIAPAPKCLYLSSLGGNSENYHEEIADFLDAHPQTQLSFQPGTFQMKLGTEKLKKLYSRSGLFFCNKEEAQKILGLSSIPPLQKEVPESARGEDFRKSLTAPTTPAYGHPSSGRRGSPLPFTKGESDLKKLLKGLYDLGPKIVCITDGPKGAYALDGSVAGQKEYWFQPPYPDPAPPQNRTGAGDAFAAAFTAALILGKPVPVALMWAPINAAYVVQEIGAQKGLLSRDALEKLLASAPKNYRPQKLNDR